LPAKNMEIAASSGIERLKPGVRVAVAFSGGVDSAVSAVILREHGFEVRAYHLVLTERQTGRDEVRAAAEALSLPLEIIDVSSEFEGQVVRPFVEAYVRGLTPNPCVACNPAIKFSLLWEKARERGAEYLATGHYAALGRSPETGDLVLARARHIQKDQSYFLCRLTRTMLARSVFPLAGLSKTRVKRRAAALGLKDRSESQEICFLLGENYRDFLLSRLESSKIRPGNFVDPAGRVLGRHRGVIHYTVGQRRGLNLPGPTPYYVTALDPDNNQVVIGTKAETYSRSLRAGRIVWSLPPKTEVFSALVQIRSRQRPAPARVRLLSGDQAEVIFDQAQTSVTPGQAAAFYQGNVLMGGGWIEKALIFDKQPLESF